MEIPPELKEVFDGMIENTFMRISPQRKEILTRTLFAAYTLGQQADKAFNTV